MGRRPRRWPFPRANAGAHICQRSEPQRTPAQPRTGALAGTLHWFTEDVRTPGCQVYDLDDDGVHNWDTFDMRDATEEVEVYPEYDMLSEIRSSWVHPDTPEQEPPASAAPPANPGWLPWWRVDQLGDANGDTFLVRTRMKNRSGEACSREA